MATAFWDSVLNTLPRVRDRLNVAAFAFEVVNLGYRIAVEQSFPFLTAFVALTRSQHFSSLHGVNRFSREHQRAFG